MMLTPQDLPKDINLFVGAEAKDFIVKSQRAYPRKSGLFLLGFGLFWLLFTSVFFAGFFGSLFAQGVVHFTVNGTPTTASWDDLSPLLMPGLFILVFTIVGMAVFISGLYRLFKKGPYFIGTPTRLIEYRKGNIHSIDWEQFTGNINLNGDNQTGNLILQMRSGRMVSKKNSSDRFVPDVIFMIGIPHAFEVEQICRKRIKENDPTPVNNR